METISAFEGLPQGGRGERDHHEIRGELVVAPNLCVIVAGKARGRPGAVEDDGSVEASP